ncbi:sulfite transporter TauE/SafE [Acinetobacter sp. NCu2D-2]|uniref:sulfite exporter TauE/SafE family protein n=1 Tax=Acinetobacter sp. NCu2D-2 TaxID=1608473 RepID=UPI0007CDF476|nr:sulfite exporter TauE/SafE family protein [Acinetobacter sp. NCu2D-2]ANF81377.1 sulfite transporter TauE/SafE [Acinetobacter sp. NCu2D-2]
MTWLVFILGSICAGFVQGLTGFAFALVAMSFWVWVLPPQLAAPLTVFASVWSHLISLRQEPKSGLSKKHLVLPYIVAGLIGVPLGTYLLHIVPSELFKMILGIFLLCWCPIMLFKPQFAVIQRSNRLADTFIGWIGGILGGLGGFCGAIPSAWVMLKQLPKQQQRYILRHFNFAIQIFTLITYLLNQTINMSHIYYLPILMVFVSIPAILGAKLFYKISEITFNRLVLGLLFCSGCFLLISTTSL